MKKIFCIFAVVLILIMATVPCFAEKPGYYNQLLSYYPFSQNGISIVVNSETIDISGTVSSIPEWGQFPISTATYFKRDGTKYAIIFPSDTGYKFGINGYASYYSSYIFQAQSSSSWFGNLYLYISSESLDSNISIQDFWFNVVDLTSIYGMGNEPTLEQFFIDYPEFGQRHFSKTSQSVYTGSFFDPIINFYSKLPETFHYFGSLFTNSGVGFSVFFWAMLMISIVVFIICLVIRRCRS